MGTAAPPCFVAVHLATRIAAPASDRREFLPDPLTGLVPRGRRDEMAAMQRDLQAARDLVLRHAGRSDDAIVPGLGLHVQHAASTPTLTVYQPMLCVVLQGAKRVMIGDRTLRYDTASYFVGSIEVPASGCVIEGSPAEPYVALSLALDVDALAGLVAEEAGAGAGDDEVAGFGVGAVTPELVAACARLVALLAAPRDVPTLAPMIRREILYRLLQGGQGGLMRQVARSGSRLARVRTAIGWLRDHFDETVRTETLAGLAGMSLASFHRHFRAATAMTPLQYQKALRLQEARRLLVAEPDAARAAYAVGYESASQFSREYARLFGLPPARDAARLRAGGDALVPA